MFTANVDEESLTGHSDLHSDVGAQGEEHPGRVANPTIKATGLAWLEFDKPDLDRAQMFARDFGFVVHDRSADSLFLRGYRAGSACMVIRKAPQARPLPGVRHRRPCAIQTSTHPAANHTAPGWVLV